MIRETEQLETLLGINNKVSSRKMQVFREEKPAGRFLQNAVNVDMDSSGVLQRRRGYQQILEQPGTTYIWSGGGECYVVAEKTLYSFDGSSLTEIDDIAADVPAMCESPIGAIISDGALVKYVNSGSLFTLALPNPSPVPTVATASGTFPEGKYIVSFANSSGNNLSGTSDPIQLSLPDSSGLSFSLPASTYDIVVYVSNPGGDVMYNRGVIPAGSTSFSISSLAFSAEPPSTMFRSPLPAGEYLCMHHARLVSARSNLLFFSDPFKYGLYDRVRGFIVFPKEITTVFSLGAFLYVGTAKRLVQLEGVDLAEATYNEIYDKGVVPGSLSYADNGDRAYVAIDGEHVMTVVSSGEYRLIEEAVILPEAAGATAVVSDYDGYSQYTLDLQRPNTNTAQATSYLEAEVVRRGNLVNQELNGG